MILVLGGTSDSLLICQHLNKKHKDYIVSVTTKYGEELSSQAAQRVLLGPLDLEKMISLILKEHITTVIDATHPYATEVSKTAIQAVQTINEKHLININSLPSAPNPRNAHDVHSAHHAHHAHDIPRVQYVRYERKSLLDEVDYSKLYTVDSIESACALAHQLGKNIFLGTGSKTLRTFWEALQGKRLIARVLPTSPVIKACEEIGFLADQIIAMKGPFSEEMNEACFRTYKIDLVITKESGQEGGFIEKINACKNVDIPVIVIKRAPMNYPYVVHQIEDILKE